MTDKKTAWIIIEGKKYSWLKVKQGRDSTYLIPGENNRDGTHFSAHGSGIVNVRNASRSLDVYDFEKQFKQTLIDNYHLALVPASVARYALVVKKIPKDIEKSMITEIEEGTIINIDIGIVWLKDNIEEWDLNGDHPKDFVADFPDHTVFFSETEDGELLLYSDKQPNVLFHGDKWLKLFENTELGRKLGYKADP